MHDAVEDHLLNSLLRVYLERDDVQSARLMVVGKKPDGQPIEAISMTRGAGGVRFSHMGIHSYIKFNHLPREVWGIKRRTVATKKKGSSATIGIRVDNRASDWVKRNGAPLRKGARLDAYSTQLFHLIEKKGYFPQAAQVPVHLPGLSCITAADLIVTNARGELILIELKTGAPVLQRGYRLKPREINHVTAHRKNAWFLQVGYTMLGLRHWGVPISRCCVINVYQDGQEMVAVELPLPSWTRAYLPNMELAVTGVVNEQLNTRTEKEAARSRRRALGPDPSKKGFQSPFHIMQQKQRQKGMRELVQKGRKQRANKRRGRDAILPPLPRYRKRARAPSFSRVQSIADDEGDDPVIIKRTKRIKWSVAETRKKASPRSVLIVGAEDGAEVARRRKQSYR